MEPSQKKVKITHHFRVALKPQNINNLYNNVKKQSKKQNDIGKENIQVITISDDEEEDEEKKTKKKNDNKNVVVVENKIVGLKREKSSLQLLQPPCNTYIAPPKIHHNIIDHDGEMYSDVFCEPHYAWDSFAYDREQEIKFRSRKYISGDQQITPHIRARLIDWLVQIQDRFSLYHETLYMSVKIADQYLMRKKVSKPNLQLLYMTSMWIAAKFDERLPPVEVCELIQQCGDVYTREQAISLEVDILITLDFNIRFPLSYGFLRRYARCTRSSQKTLTLARYILETSLLAYDMIEILDSKLAAAALLLAFKMLDEAWTETAEFYTGYKQEELSPIVTQLNNLISRPTDKRISYIREKYCNDVFLCVARIRPLA